ncbi:hypothetical protein ABG067_001724 [Albugo candida]
MHDTSKAIDSRREPSLGSDSFVHTFAHINHPDIELATFKSTMAKELAEYDEEAVSNFDRYSSSDLYCSACDRFIGWAYAHNDYRRCLLESAKFSDKSEGLIPKNARVSKKKKSLMQEQKKIVQEVLKGECVILLMDWWSYQICYGKEVRQFHREPDGSKTSDWSMGVYVPESDARYQTNEHGENLVQFYADGQACDENAAKRSTKVIYICCLEKTEDVVTVKSIKEPSLCYYEIELCIAKLCHMNSNSKKIEKKHRSVADNKCKVQHQQNEKQQTPATFFAYLWTEVISDDSSELDWMPPSDEIAVQSRFRDLLRKKGVTTVICDELSCIESIETKWMYLSMDEKPALTDALVSLKAAGAQLKLVLTENWQLFRQQPNLAAKLFLLIRINMILHSKEWVSQFFLAEGMEAIVYLLPHPPSLGPNPTYEELGSAQREDANVTQTEIGFTRSLKSRKTTALLATIYEEVLHLLFVLANSDEGIFAMVKSSELFFLRLLFLLSIPNPLGQQQDVKVVNLFRGRILKLLGIIACYSRTTQIAISHAFTFSASTQLEARRFETISALFMKNAADTTFQSTVLSFMNILINTTLDPMDRNGIRDDLQHLGMVDILEKYHRQGQSVHSSELFLQLQIYFRQLGNDITRPYHRRKCVTDLEIMEAENKDSETYIDERFSQNGSILLDEGPGAGQSEMNAVLDWPSSNKAPRSVRSRQNKLQLHEVLNQLQHAALNLDEESAKKLSDALNLIRTSILPTSSLNVDCLVDNVADTIDSPVNCMQTVEINANEKDAKKAPKSSASKQSSIGSRVMSIPFIQGLRRGIGYTPPSSPIRDSRSRKVVEAFSSKQEQDSVGVGAETATSPIAADNEFRGISRASNCESPKSTKIKKSKRLHLNFSLPSLNHSESVASPVEPDVGSPPDSYDNTPGKAGNDSSPQDRMMNSGRRFPSPRRKQKSRAKAHSKNLGESNAIHKGTTSVPDFVGAAQIVSSGKEDAAEPLCQESVLTVKDNPAYSKFFKLLAMGAPSMAVKAKMEMAGLKSELLDTPDAKIVIDNTAAQINDSNRHVECAPCLPPPPPTKAAISASTALSGLFRQRLDKVGMAPDTPNVASTESTSILVKDDPNYAKFFKMVNMGVPLEVVKNKMKLAGFVEELLDKPNENLATAVAAHKIKDNGSSSSQSNDITRMKRTWLSSGGDTDLPAPPPIRKSTTRPLYWQYIKDDEAIKGTVWEDLADVNIEADRSQCNNAEVAMFSHVRLNDTDILELERRFPANPGIQNKSLLVGNQPGSLSLSSPAKQLSSLSESTPLSPRVVFLIDRSRSNNISIIARQFRLSNENIRDAISKLDTSLLTLERVQGLLKILPTDEEVAAISGFAGDATLLNGAEKLLKELIAIPRLQPRLFTLQSRLQFPNLVSETQNRIDRLQAACIELLESRDLKSTLFLILQVGNKMNEGTSRGEAKGFSLSDLPKLSQLKTADKKETLLHFIAKYLRQKCGEAVQLQNSLTCLCDIQNVPILEISHDVDRLKECIDAISSEVDAKKIRKAIDEMEIEDTYIEYMSKFVEQASPIVAAVEKKWTEALVSARETIVKFEKAVAGDNTAAIAVAPEDTKAARGALLTGLSSIFSNIHEFSFQLMRTDRENEMRRIRDEKLSLALKKNQRIETERTKGCEVGPIKDRICVRDSKSPITSLHEHHADEAAPEKNVLIEIATLFPNNREDYGDKSQDQKPDSCVHLSLRSESGITIGDRKGEGSYRNADPVHYTAQETDHHEKKSGEKFHGYKRVMKNRCLRQGSVFSASSVPQKRSDFVNKTILLTKNRNKLHLENKKTGLLISKRHSHRKSSKEDVFIRDEIRPEQVYLSETVLLSEDELQAGTLNYECTLQGIERKRSMGRKRMVNSKRQEDVFIRDEIRPEQVYLSETVLLSEDELQAGTLNYECTLQGIERKRSMGRKRMVNSKRQVNIRSVQSKLSLQPTEHAQLRTRTAAL